MLTQKIPRNLVLTKSKYGLFRLVLYKNNQDIQEENQNNALYEQYMQDTQKMRPLDSLSSCYFVPLSLCSFEQPPKNDENIKHQRDYETESTQRAKRTILDLALNNKFIWFVTFTFDRRKIDRTNINLVRNVFLQAISNYIKKQRYNNPKYNLNYIAVPEWHKNKEAIHFHCLMTDLPDLSFNHYDVKTQHRVYKSDYFYEKFGSTFAVKIQEYNRMITYYISKYVTKENMKVFESGKSRYFRSKNLDRSIMLLNGKLTDIYAPVLREIVAKLQNMTADYENGMYTIIHTEDYEFIETLIDSYQKSTIKEV